MEKDLARFYSGADFLFLFHLGKRKESLEMEINLFQRVKCWDNKFERTFARKHNLGTLGKSQFKLDCAVQLT